MEKCCGEIRAPRTVCLFITRVPFETFCQMQCLSYFQYRHLFIRLFILFIQKTVLIQCLKPSDAQTLVRLPASIAKGYSEIVYSLRSSGYRCHFVFKS